MGAWKLVRLDPGTGSLVTPLQRTELTAAFRDDGRLAGSAGCNRYGTSYETTGSTLKVNPLIAATQMWCAEPDGTMTQEDAFLQAWARVAGFDIEEDHLQLTDAQGAPVFVFVLAEPSGSTTK
ncbi:MAG: META domain-containing protein [Thermoplasmata archaeon]